MIGKKVIINKSKGEIIEQNRKFVLVLFESGSKIVFNSHGFKEGVIQN